ncbi:MAG: helix-turn-helix domain-containing protein [Capsulimonadaceae bacterium]
MDKTTWTLAELAAETGLTARTIRYYIARNLLDGPDLAGRGAVYGRAHVDRLHEIRRQQAEGRMLAEIGQPAGRRPLPPAVSWQHYLVGEGVVVQVRGDLGPWRLKRIREAIADFASQLPEEKPENGNGPI